MALGRIRVGTAHLALTLAALCGLVGGCAADKAAAPGAELANLRPSTRTIALLPPQVEIYAVARDEAKERVPPQEMQVTNDLIDLAKQYLGEQGRSTRATAAGLVNADQSEQAVRDRWVRESYDRMRQALHPIPTTLTTVFSGNLGDEAKAVAQELKTDGLLLVRCHAEQRTGGSVAGNVAGKMLVGIATAGLFIPAPDPAGWISVDAALVEGKSGNVLWAHSASNFKMPFMAAAFDRSVLDALMKDVFATLPKAL